MKQVTLTDVRAAVEHQLRSRYPNLRAPQGEWDNVGRWYPREEERRLCCDRVWRPSRLFPKTLLTHCCTLRHCVELYGANERNARRVSDVLSDASLFQLYATLFADTPVEVVAALYWDARSDVERAVALRLAQLLQVPQEEIILVVLAHGL